VPELTLQVDVEAPPAVTWAAMTDWNRQGEWMLGTRVEAGPDGGRAVDGTLRAWSGAGPLGFWDTMVITAWDPPHRCEVRHTGKVVRGSGVFEILELPLGALGRAGWPLVRPAFAGGVKLSLKRFAAFAATYVA
jgi:hypothetical protein